MNSNAMHLLSSYLGSALPLIVLGGVTAILVAWLKGSTEGSGPPAPVARPLMTQRERAVLAQLERILPAYRIHAQVAMGALLKVPARPGRRSHHSDRNAFAQKIIDFVVEDPATGRVVALIEVDDRSHDPSKDRTRDAMTGAAGYRTLRIPASARPTFDEVLKVIGILRDDETSPGPTGSRIAPG